MTMPFVFQHFWLLHGLFWLVAMRLLSPNLARRGWHREKSTLLFKRFGVAIMVVSLVLWSIQLSAGPAPEPLVHSWPVPQKWLAIGVALLVWLAIAVWIFLGAGARVLAEAFGEKESKVRVFAVLGLFVSLFTNLLSFGLG